MGALQKQLWIKEVPAVLKKCIYRGSNGDLSDPKCTEGNNS